jgi:dihydroflavonol-4-reductase
MIVAVTGASGHLGANLVRALLKENKTVRVLVNTNRKALNGLNVETFQANVVEPFSLTRALSGVDVVYHLAAIISLSMDNWKSIEAVNVTGTHNVVEACLKCGVRRLIHFSSIHAIEQTPMDIPVDERRPLIDARDCPPYDRSKAEGEREVRQGIEQGLDAVILNPTAVIGPNDYQLSHFGNALLLMAQGKLPALIEGGFNWVDARDIAAAAIKAENLAPLGAKYILSGHYASVADLSAVVSEITGVPSPRLVVPAWLARTGAPVVTAYNRITRNRPLYTSVSIRALNNCNPVINHDRATRELNYHPRPLKETIFDSLVWFQNNGMLEKSIKLQANFEKR